MPNLEAIVNLPPEKIASGLESSNTATFNAIATELSPIKKVQVLIKQIEGICLERETEITAIAALFVCSQHGFLLGPPGTGKSFLIELISRHMGGKLFSYQFNEYSKPDEVFGPLNPKRLMEDGVAVRNEEHRIGESTDAYLDEIFKAPGNVLNSLLAVLNERIVYNPNPQQRDFRTCIGSSNEVPESASTDALLDRFMFKAWVGYLSDDAFETLLSRRLSGYQIPRLVSLTLSDRDSLKNNLATVECGFNLARFLRELRVALKAEGFEVVQGDLLGAAKQVSDRKWLQIIDFLRAIALIEGTKISSSIVKKFLPACLWFKTEEIEEIERIVDRVCEEVIGKDAESLVKEGLTVYRGFIEAGDANESVKQLGISAIALIEGNLEILKEKYPDEILSIDTLAHAKAETEEHLSDIISELNQLNLSQDDTHKSEFEKNMSQIEQEVMFLEAIGWEKPNDFKSWLASYNRIVPIIHIQDKIVEESGKSGTSFKAEYYTRMKNRFLENSRQILTFAHRKGWLGSIGEDHPLESEKDLAISIQPFVLRGKK